MRASVVARETWVASLRIRGGDPEVVLVLLLGALIVGAAAVAASTAIGSGDYGQWLMTSRPYLGLEIPAYRASWAVPPVVPWLLAIAQLAAAPMVAVHLVAVVLLIGLGVAAYAAAASLFGSRLAGVMASTATLLLTDRFLDLFAFGGLLQAAAIVFLWLAIAALWRAGSGGRFGWTWWLLGAWCMAMGALAHTGTGVILLPSCLAVAVLVSLRSTAEWRWRLARLLPIAAALAVVAAYWLMVVLPYGVDFVSNPASLAYRGVDRLISGLLEYPGTLPLVALATAFAAMGAARDLLARRIGPTLVVSAWMVVTVGSVALAALSATPTDYPRFATPLLAPFVVAAGGVLAALLRWAGVWLAERLRRGSAPAWSVAAAVALVALTISPAVGRYGTDARGYRMPDATGMVEAADWITRNVPAGRAVLAPAREGKWIEGLTGHGSLFPAAIRYSFRPEEWERSFAADALLRSHLTLLNEFFATRLLDPTGVENTPRRVVIGANHGGEFVDLLQMVTTGTRVLDGHGGTLASLPEMAGAPPKLTTSYAEESYATPWSTELHGTPLGFRQTVVLTRDASTMELRVSVTTTLPTAGFEMELAPAGQLPATDLQIDGSQATLTFAEIGSGGPVVRLLVAGGGATLSRSPNGGVLIRNSGKQMRLLVTDLTGSPSPTVGLPVLQPSELVSRYTLGAVLLPRDSVYEARKSRLGRLGFRVAESIGSYVILTRQ